MKTSLDQERVSGAVMDSPSIRKCSRSFGRSQPGSLRTWASLFAKVLMNGSGIRRRLARERKARRIPAAVRSVDDIKSRYNEAMGTVAPRIPTIYSYNNQLSSMQPLCPCGGPSSQHGLPQEVCEP